MAVLISGVYIENFRSFRKSWFASNGDVIPIIGLNSAGKSNILRALDAFFNDTVDGRPIDFAIDLSGYLPKKKKKMIGVGVELKYPREFKLKGNRDFFNKNGLTEEIAIYKEWTLDPAGTPRSATTFGSNINDLRPPADSSDAAALAALIRSIKYHYVSNHVRPADKVAEILLSLRPEIMKSWRNKYGDSAQFLDYLSTAADQMFSAVSKSVSQGINGLTINAALPEDLADLAFELGMNAMNDSNLVHDLSQEGSGAQSFTLLHFLDLQDSTARRRTFGWTQASIWGIEEPESFLHSGLRTRFSGDLLSFAQSDRRQIFLTTHDFDFIRSAENSAVTTIDATGSTVDLMTSREALQLATKERISAYRHPLVTFADDPLVVVEGKTDKLYLEAALRKLDLRPRWRLISPDEDFEPGSSGKALQQYFQMNRSALASRPDAAFVLALIDWEDSGKKSGFDKALKVHPYSSAIVCPAAITNPELNKTFVGIERYLPTDLIVSKAEPSKTSWTNAEPQQLAIDRTHLSEIKTTLATAVKDGYDVGDHMVSLVSWIDDQVSSTLYQIPIEDFL